MGIIRRVVEGIGGKAGDAVATLASLSPKQLDDIERQKAEYLSAKPSVDDPDALEQTYRLLAAGGVELYNAYLPQIDSLYLPVNIEGDDTAPFDAEHNIRSFSIRKWVSDANERSLDKLVNVYEALSGEECNIALIFQRTCQGTNVSLAVVNTRNDADNIAADSFEARLEGALRGNFPGSDWGDVERGIPRCLQQTRPYSVACVSNIPTEKSEKFVSQTIEKLLDGIVPTTGGEEYTLILLATPMVDVDERKLRLGELYSGLAPYASWTTSFTLHESLSQMSGASVGLNVGASAGMQVGQNEARTISDGSTDNVSQTVTDSTSDAITENLAQTEGTNSSITNTEGTNVSQSLSTSATGSVKAFGSGVDVSVGETTQAGTSTSVSTAAGSSEATTLSQGTSSTVGKAIANTLGRAVTSSVANAVGTSQGANYGVNFGANFSRSSNVTATIGKDEGITQTFTNFTIKHALALLEEQMKRYEQSAALGMWDFAAYVLSEDLDVASNVAHSYLALTQGEQSYLSTAAVNLWRGDMGERSEAAKTICSTIRTLRHPVFGINPDAVELSQHYLVYPVAVTATTPLTGKELAYSLNFPKRSVTGFPVLECAEFARDVVKYDGRERGDAIRIGDVFHMRRVEPTEVDLSLNSLASHVFVTGSTGSGKSNTVYRMIDAAYDLGVKFLVVEPAKGEYKEVFGGLPDVSVFGTNPKVAPLLRLNPFSFPGGVHVLEHLDRLVELFNVCWPMYAAMPAVLKDAVERSYRDCGWDLVGSVNAYGEGLYPSFKDVARNVREIIESSEYDEENKGAYKGSLLTRLQSLTAGLNGLILSDKGLSDQELFDKNVIIDLSRVGSSETRSLLMGLLVLKLQEYRSSERTGMNAGLRHLTVLEEAHNILRRTSTEQTSDGANLQGKSVEMLTNAIAEMRTYGEGFVIVDQAPGLLDMAVIRNTNTKVIMRLAEQGDRELVGRAANLTDEQIVEVSRLPQGVAAVYQNEWVQPVLCKIDRADVSEGGYRYEPSANPGDGGRCAAALAVAEMLSACAPVRSEGGLRDLRELMDRAGLGASSQVRVIRMLDNPPVSPKMTVVGPIMSELFPDVAEVAKRACEDMPHEPSDWNRRILEELRSVYSVREITRVHYDILQGVLTDYLFNQLHDEERLREWAEGGVR